MIDKLPNHTSLKEWSSVIEALGDGRQVILIRKGGLADPHFGLEADRFYLYPTFFHQPDPEVEPQTVDITHWCEAVQSWRVSDLAVLAALEPFVVMSRETLETRYRFRQDQAIHVIGVRAFALPAPQSIRVKSDYLGCRSWISVDEEIAISGSRQAVAETELRRKLDAIESVIGRAAEPDRASVPSAR